MLITEILARNSRVYGDQTALIERSPGENLRREITWRQFDEQSNRLARALQAGGVQKGDRVVLLMMNFLDWLPIYFGILRTGAWAVPLNFRFLAETIGRCVATAEARAIIFGEEFIDIAVKPRAKKKRLISMSTPFSIEGPLADPSVKVSGAGASVDTTSACAS